MGLRGSRDKRLSGVQQARVCRTWRDRATIRSPATSVICRQIFYRPWRVRSSIFPLKGSITVTHCYTALQPTASRNVKVNVKCKSDYSVQNDESQRGHCTDKRRVRRKDKKVRRDVTKDDSRRWGAVTCDGRLFHRQTSGCERKVGNALSPTVDRRERRTSRVVDKAERNCRLDSVSAEARILWQMKTKMTMTMKRVCEVVLRCKNVFYVSLF